MRILRRPQLIRRHPPSAVTVGNFDGVHLGHQALVRRMVGRAQECDLAPVAVTFEPLPGEFFQGARAPVRLTGLREKLMQLQPLGLHCVCVLRFSAELAGLSAEDFVTRILHQGLNARQVLIGHDFRFGKDRRGDIALLEQMGSDLNFAVEEMAAFQIDGQRVSSTLIREALEGHDLAAAKALLGRPFNIAGRVAPGAKLGRELGFPTANINLDHRRVPIAGVFAVSVAGIAEQPLAGVANLGTRPAVGGGVPLLEVHVFDFQGDLYGRRLDVSFHHFLREEQDFPSLDALTAQMREDARKGRSLLSADGVRFWSQK